MIVYRAHTTLGSAAGNTRTINKPAGTADGDLLLLQVAMNSSAAPATLPTGFVLVPSAEVTGTHNIRIYAKLAGASEPADYTVTFTGSPVTALGLVAVYSDTAAVPAAVLAAPQTNSSSTNIGFPSISPTAADSLLMAFGSINTSGTAHTPDGAMTERYEAGTLPRVYLMTQALSASGATGTRTATSGFAITSKTVMLDVEESAPPVPNPPSALTATATGVSTIDLGWTDNSTDEVTFEIERSADGTTGWTNIGSNSPGDTTFTDTGLSEHTVYYYRVKAVNAAGSSAYTSVANATTLVAPPTTLVVAENGATQLDLSWTDNSGVEDDYRIERSANGTTGWSEIGINSAGDTTYSDTGLTPGTAYFYRVRAKDGADYSTYSNVDSDTTLGALAAPTGLTVTPILSTELAIAFSDANADEEGFEIERSANGTTGWTVVQTQSGLTWRNTGLSAATTYFYRVRAYRGADYSSYSGTASATTYATLVAPTGLTVTPFGATEVQISWSDSNVGESGFSLERSPDGTTGWAEVATPAASPATDSGLTPETEYWYRVRAYREGSIEYGPYSSVGSGETLVAAQALEGLHLFLLKPAIVFSARVNLPAPIYPLDEIPFDSVIDGAYTDIHVGQTVLLGSTLYGDDLGRQRIRAAPTGSILKVGRSSRGTHDGELDLIDNAYITVLDDFRVWSKTPFILPDGTIWKDSDLAFTDQTTLPLPVANAGPAFAATIDPTTGVITVAFDGSSSFATADGATIADYAWDLKDGSVTAGAVNTATVTATFPAGFRYINLGVTDSNGKGITSHRPVFARDPVDDGYPGGAVADWSFDSHRIEAQGQEVAVTVRSAIDAGDYPDGTLVLIFEEPESAADRSHMIFTGWHQTDPASIAAGRTGLLRDVSLQCVDVAGRLDTLPGFPVIIEANEAPVDWSQMSDPNIDKYLHYLLMWHSTTLEVADWTWSGTETDYEFIALSSDGESMFAQVNRKAQSMCPDHRLTCNRRGQLRVIVDPMLQDVADRTATVQATLTPADYSDIRYTHQRPPRVHWLRASAIQANEEPPIVPLFCVSPGSSPGQGGSGTTHGEQLAIDQTGLNAVTGHRYARMNASNGHFTVTLVEGDDLGIEPADLTWVELTISAAVAAQRGLSFTSARGLVASINIRYAHERTGIVRTVDLAWELETVGTPAATVIPDVISPIDDNWWILPPVDPPFDFGLVDGVQTVALIGSDGDLFRTSDFQSSPPTWDWVPRATLGITDVQLYTFVVDPFSPLYRGLGSTVNGWVTGKTSIWRIVDIFGATPTATAVHTFTYDEDDIDPGGAKIHFWRTIRASFGRFQEVETDNPWIVCCSHYRDVTGHEGTWAIHSVDGGVTWSSEIQITAHYDTSATGSLTRNRPVGLYLSPKTPGLAYVAAYSATGSPATADGYVSADWGATWAAMTSPDIQPGHWLASAIHAPWPANADDSLVFHGHVTIGSPIEYRLKRVTGATIEDVSPTDAGILYGVAKTGFGVRTYDSNRSFVAVGAVGNEISTSHDDDEHAVFVSNDGGDTWTLIYGPTNQGFFFGYDGYEVAFGGNNPAVLFIWGGTPGESLVIGYSDDFGATVLDKEGNIFTDFFASETIPSSILGVCGGDPV